MSAWTLIAILAMPGGGISVATREFNSFEVCTAIAAELRKRTPPIAADCAPAPISLSGP